MSVLAVENLVVAYGPIRALRGISLEVGEGELVSVVGPNGAGKSTLMRALSGIIPVHSGTILLDGEDVTKMSSHRRFALGIAQVAEGRAILQRMTVLENLLLAYENGREDRPADAVFTEIFERFPILSERRFFKAGTMSGGEQQMLAFARALVAKPRILLMDEPSLGLAPLIIRQVFEMIRRLREAGTAMLLVEQNVHEALRVADCAYVLELGRVVAHGAASELMGRPEIMRAYLGQSAVAPSQLPDDHNGSLS